MKSIVPRTLAAILLVSPIVAAAADITYNVDETIGDGTVVGTVTTNGTIGILKTAQVVAFDLTITAPNLVDGPSYTLSNSNAVFDQYNKGGLSATSTSLSFNYSASGYSFIFAGSSPEDYWCGADTGTGTCNGETDPAEVLGETTSGANAQVLSEAGVGEKVIGTVGAVPAPTTLTLFSLGLVALGVVRRQGV